MRPTSRATVATLAAAMAVTAAAFVGGCAHHQAPATQPIAEPATPETVQSIRQSYQQRDPSTVVGLVIATLPESNLAAVGDVPVGEFKAGDVVTFIDSNQTTIAVGNVVNTTADAVHVRYEPQGDSPRAPREGDLAVKVKS
jgi:hypothetical protein